MSGGAGAQAVQVLRKCYGLAMRSISQRELRNDNARVMREVAAGASFRVTSRGVPVALISPAADEPQPPWSDLILREGTGVMDIPPGVRVGGSTADALGELRGDR